MLTYSCANVLVWHIWFSMLTFSSSALISGVFLKLASREDSRTVGSLKKESSSLGRGSVFLDCYAACLGFFL